MDTFMKYAQWVPILGILFTILYIWYGDFDDCLAQDKYPWRYWSSIAVQVIGTMLILLSLG